MEDLIGTRFFIGDESSSSRTSVSDEAASTPPHDINLTSLGSKLEKLKTGESPSKVLVGICAMRKKSNSKPMKEIIERLLRFELIEVKIFDQDIITNCPVQDWPLCDCLVSFHSTGFPLHKAIDYWKLRKPFLLNDLEAQYHLKDRRDVYKLLEYAGIDQPHYQALDRDIGDASRCMLVEGDDQVEVNGQVFQKPFVEKPVSAEDHNIYIYYPSSAGGGSQRLFRKIGSRSSVYSPVSKVRKTGSYIYEEFMPTDGTDVKVYTVGPDYAHAEARKSPALDGKVERDKDGKEVRYPILLSAKEKLIARNISQTFKQTVCGFDLLRANGKSYVCDVNGFSFVKTSTKYYDDCASILGNMIIRQLLPHLPMAFCYQPEDPPIVPTTAGTMMELRCVIAVIRHGDRTPKQKMKMEVRHKKFFDLFEKYGGYKKGELKLKKPKQLQEILDIARSLLDELQHHLDPELEDKRTKLQQLKSVLEMYGHFSGIYRKVQIKYQPKGAPPHTSSSDEDIPRQPSLVLILKWGGELTPAGKTQAEELGQAFRCIYPGGEGDYGNIPGLGFLRLHSTFRHDLKLYASDEGRVQMTAAAFTKGLLALEGELTPILVQMVKSANTNGLLDNDCEATKTQNMVKQKLKDIFNKDKDFTEEDIEKLAPMNSKSVMDAIKYVKNPRKMCETVCKLIQKLRNRIQHLRDSPKTRSMQLYHRESWELMMRRWGKLEKDFKTKNDDFDISKIPDIFDCIKYDLQHNQGILQFDQGEELYVCSKALADIIIPLEYGVTKQEKLKIATSIVSPLMRKIYSDLQRNLEDDCTRLDSRYSQGVSTPHRHVRTRLYFTSESHIHSLLNVLRFGCLLNESKDEQWRRAMEYLNAVTELNYMTQIVIMMYEDQNKPPQSDERFHVELHFSSGAYMDQADKNYPKGEGYRPQARENRKEKEKLQKDQEKYEKSSNVGGTIDDKSVPENTPVAPRESCTDDIVHVKKERAKSAGTKKKKPKARSYGYGELKDIIFEEECSPSRDLKTIKKARSRGSSSGEEDDNSLVDTASTKTLVPDDENNPHKLVMPPPFLNHRHSFAGLFGKSLVGLEKYGQGLSGGSLFSTRLLSWSSSAPDLQRAVEGLTDRCPRVAAVRPLETLHNSLTLRQMELFLVKMTQIKLQTPQPSPPQTPHTSHYRNPFKKDSLHLSAIQTSSYNNSAEPSSHKTSADDSKSRQKPLKQDNEQRLDDIVLRLKQLRENDLSPLTNESKVFCTMAESAQPRSDSSDSWSAALAMDMPSSEVTGESSTCNSECGTDSESDIFSRQSSLSGSNDFEPGTPH